MKLKVEEEGTGPERKWGAPIRRQAPEIFVGRALHFSATKAQLVVLVSVLVMVSTVWSVSCLLFSYSRCPRAQPFVKVGARVHVSHWVGATAHWMNVHIILWIFGCPLNPISATQRRSNRACKACTSLWGPRRTLCGEERGGPFAILAHWPAPTLLRLGYHLSIDCSRAAMWQFQPKAGCIEHVTIFSWMCNIVCCLVAGLGLALGLGLDLVSGF